MATRLFARDTTSLNGYVISPAPTYTRAIVGSTFGSGAAASAMVIAAGASVTVGAANARFATALPNYSGTAVGSYKICHSFGGATVPTNIWTKVRVHRGTVAGTVITVATSSQWSDEILTNKTVQRWEHYIDQVDLGTWATTDALVIEYNYRNAGTASLSPSYASGNYYSNAIYAPIPTSTTNGYTTQLPVGQRLYIYSQGGIRGTSRYLKQTTTVNAASGTIAGRRDNGSVTGVSISTGTATGTKGSSNFSGSVTGVSTSTGTIAAGKQGYSGAATGTSTSSGVIAAGRQGYSGASSGASSSVGTIGAGTQGYSGSSTGTSTSSGSAHGSAGPTPEPPTGGAVWYDWNRVYDQKREPELVAFSGRTILTTSYSFATIRGTAGFTGATRAQSVENGVATGHLGYYGQVQRLQLMVRHRSRGKARSDLRGNRELLLLIGEL